jgi:phytoene dehydrogenase-like protein
MQETSSHWDSPRFFARPVWFGRNRCWPACGADCCIWARQVGRMADLNTAMLPERPFMLFGEMTTADPSRSPAGTESAWAYTHLPRGLADDESADTLSVAVDRVLEEHAPGFPNASSVR